MYQHVGKRLFDLFFSAVVLTIFAPLLLVVLFIVWSGDRRNPFYFATRVGLNNSDFTMIKIRSMKVDADKSGVNSTSADDERITPVGHFIRKVKLDEISQFINVLQGKMSVVGPRPNTRHWGVDLFTDNEMNLLKVKPGVTDFSSIVFSDEGDILRGSEDPDKDYNRLIRPWKSTLSLLNIEHTNFFLI